MDHELARLRAIFDEVIQAPPEARAALLVKRCGDDVALREHIEALIATAEADEPFLSEPTRTKRPLERLIELAPVPLSEGPGSRIGPYKILQKIGEGGFGVVFMAEQDQPVRRRVALKIIKLGMDTRQVVARFEQERQALALMDHPNIARVFDAGATDSGRPYFVMEYVKGDPITAFADAHKLSVRQRLDLFAQVCTAVQHAHTKGVIHRDIKPRNVLVSMVDGKPFAKVIDFGIAKATGARLTDKTLFTEHRQLIGTPEYMSPEQAEGSPDIDTRTDVYALGVLLYELLTGATPFDAARLRSAAYAEMQRIIKEEEPLAPSVRLSRSLDSLAATAAARQAEPGKLGTLIKGELDWIVMKSLDKDRARRYETPNQLAADVQRHLSGEPVLAAPPSAAYRLRKFVRKHKTGVLTGSAVFLALVLGIAGTAWQWNNARRTNQELRETIDYGLDIFKKTYLAYSGGSFPSEIKTSITTTMRDNDGNDLGKLVVEPAGAPDAEGNVTELTISAFDADGRPLGGKILFAVLSSIAESAIKNSTESQEALAERARELKAANAEIAKQLDESEWNLYAGYLSGARAAIAAGDWPGARERLVKCPQKFRGFEWSLLNEEAQAIVAEFRGAHSVAFSKDGTRMVSAGDQSSQLWDSNGFPIGDMMPGAESATFSNDGQQVVTWCGAMREGRLSLWSEGSLRISDGRSGSLIRAIPKEHSRTVDGHGLTRGVIDCDFSPDDSQMSTVTWNLAMGPVTDTSVAGTVQLRNREGWLIGQEINAGNWIWDAQFSPEGSRILTLSAKIFRLWDAYGAPIGEPVRSDAEIKLAKFSPDGTHFVIAYADDTTRMWNRDGQPLAETVRHDGTLTSVDFKHDGSQMLAASTVYGDASPYFEVNFVNKDVADFQLFIRGEGVVSSAEFSPDGNYVLVTSNNYNTGSHVARLVDTQRTPVGELYWARAIASATFSPDGKRVLLSIYKDPDNEGSSDHWVVIDAQRFGSNRKTIPTDSRSTALETEWVWGDSTSNEPEPSLLTEQREVTAASDRTLRFLDSKNREATTFRLDIPVKSARFSRDGMRLVLSREDGQTEIWDARDIEARNASIKARWNERERAEPWVAELLASPIPIREIEQVIARETGRPAIFRLAALDLYQEIDRDAKRRLEALQGAHVTKSRVIAAAMQSPVPLRRVQEALLKRVHEWVPTYADLNSGAWTIVKDPAPAQERLAAALEGAREAVALAKDNAYVLNTLGVAQYRAADFAGALETLSRSSELNATEDFALISADLAFVAMANYKLGNLEEARETLAKLRALESDPGTEVREGSRLMDQTKALLAEAEALIDPKPNPPASQ